MCGKPFFFTHKQMYNCIPDAEPQTFDVYLHLEVNLTHVHTFECIQTKCVFSHLHMLLDSGNILTLF